MKLLIRLILILVVVLGVGVFFADSLAQSAIEEGSTRALGVDTSVDSVSLGLMSGEFGLSGLTISNPSGYPSERFFGLGSAKLAVGLGTLMEDQVEVPQLVIDGVDVHLDMKLDGSSNVSVILDNLKKLARSGGDSPGADDDGAEEGGKTFVIRDLRVTNVRAHVNVDGPVKLADVEVTVPDVQMTDVGAGEGGGDGVALPELVALVLEAVLEGVSGAEGLPDQLASLLEGKLGDLDALQAQLEEQLEDAVGDAQQKLDAAAKKAQDDLQEKAKEVEGQLQDALGGLLGGKKKDG